jgi:hypothetical protein
MMPVIQVHNHQRVRSRNLSTQYHSAERQVPPSKTAKFPAALDHRHRAASCRFPPQHIGMPCQTRRVQATSGSLPQQQKQPRPCPRQAPVQQPAAGAPTAAPMPHPIPLIFPSPEISMLFTEYCYQYGTTPQQRQQVTSTHLHQQLPPPRQH